ncbi:ankyrin repeat domain-containing protein [Endozoicomonas sp. ALC020]|uniref:ankyrin repeat domain-containing protein n=1 Tax=Endozoicomonas sp. ALC020 TaxID=3403077 RepID=UPI003BAEB09B
MQPATNLKAGTVLSPVSGANSKRNQPGNFQGRASTCVGAGSSGYSPPVVGRHPSYPAAVPLADRMTTEGRNMSPRFANAMEYTSCATTNRDKFHSESDSRLREQLEELSLPDPSLLHGDRVQQTGGRKGSHNDKAKALLETILLQKALSPEIKPDGGSGKSPGFFMRRKLNGLVTKAVDNFFKKSTHNFSPASLVSSQAQQVEQLLQSFARTESGQRLYRKAVANNLVVLESLLRKAGVDINHQSPKSGDTPIIAAAKANHWSMVSLLLEEKATVHQQNKSDFHLLMLIFSAWGDYKITDQQQRELTLKALENQPEAQIKLANGQTKLLAVYAFQHAVLRNCQLFCNQLLKNSHLVSALKQEQIGSKLMIDVVMNYRDPAAATKYLVNLKDSAGRRLFDLNCKTQSGKTLLILAAKKGNTHTMETLLNTPGAVENINAYTTTSLPCPPSRWTAYTYAHYYSEAHQNRYILEKLVKRGAWRVPAYKVKEKEPDSIYGHSYHFGSYGGDDGPDGE